jgi:hypothetical protein
VSLPEHPYRSRGGSGPPATSEHTQQATNESSNDKGVEVRIVGNQLAVDGSTSKIEHSEDAVHIAIQLASGESRNSAGIIGDEHTDDDGEDDDDGVDEEVAVACKTRRGGGRGRRWAHQGSSKRSGTRHCRSGELDGGVEAASAMCLPSAR